MRDVQTIFGRLFNRGGGLDIDHLFKKILAMAGDMPVFIAGGPVRDWLLERPTRDIDLVVRGGAVDAAGRFSRETGGAFVLLDEGEDVARVVVDGLSFDFSGFRKGAATIEDDLSKRDFTINAMAVPLEKISSRIRGTDAGLLVNREDLTGILVDPQGGLRDLERRTIRAVSLKNILDDPLRMLRAFRFSALLGFSIQGELLAFISAQPELVTDSAPERINYELERMMASRRAGDGLRGLLQTGLLGAIIPEVTGLKGVEQPGFHHLDVLGHCLEAVSCMDRLVLDPCIRFENCGSFRKWLSENSSRIPYLKWAAFLHDFGKPSQKGVREDGRVTFYDHDRKGSEMADNIGARLRWSARNSAFVKRLVRMHMRPFHLLNDLRKGGPSKRAMRKLLEEIGPDYPALFLLSMADSMAGCGPLKPAGLDRELSLLSDLVHDFYLKRLVPVRKAPPLLNGRDVMELFSIGPGPLVGRALEAVEAGRIEGSIKTKGEAISWLKAHFPHDLSVS